MLLPRTAALVVVLGLGTGVAVTPSQASARPGPADRVSHAEYRAITRGMTQAQVVRITDHAHSTADHLSHCTVRYYRGWDRRHFRVAVLFDDERRVELKDTVRRNETLSFTCH